MQISAPDTPNSDSSKVAYKTSRRSFVAAAAVFAAMVAAQKTNAMARPPRDRDRDRDRGGRGCFLRGTRILTPQGEVAVEDLAVGNLVTTIDGTAKPIKWIGCWSVKSTSAERWPGEVLPIKVARSALGHLVPHTDLFLSPFHSVYMDGLLIPVRNLVNGRSITHCSSVDVDTIEYFHVELMRHDVIFSEGAPTETLLAAASYDDVRPQSDIDQPRPYAPRVAPNRGAVICSRLRSAVSPWIDRRQPGDVIWERLVERAETGIAA
jgi:hypothetical protein